MNFLSGTIRANGAMQFVQDGAPFAVNLSPAYRDRLKGIQSVTLGIRPEHIFAQEGGEHMADFTANIEVVEPVGNEIFVYFTTGTPSQYVARFAADRPPDVGRSYTLHVDTTKLHFFEKETGKAL
jgi:multiple sugar transport system ATP-binding protein